MNAYEIVQEAMRLGREKYGADADVKLRTEPTDDPGRHSVRLPQGDYVHVCDGVVSLVDK